MVERLVANEKVVGSSPIARSKIKYIIYYILLDLSFIFQQIANFFIKKRKIIIFYKFLFKIFKFFLKKKIVLNFTSFKFYVYPNKKDLSFWMLRYLKIWDEPKINLIINKSGKSDFTFIDIGCNYGAYSIPISKIVKNSQIYAFDPSEKSISRIKENIKLNKIFNIELFNIGIAEKRKKVFFDDNINNYKNSGSFQISSNNHGKEILVESIDNLIEQKIIKPKKKIFIKMDIEGYEFYALQGLKKSLKNYKIFILFEFSKKIFENHLNFEKSFTNFIKENNLMIFDKKMRVISVKYLFENIHKIPKEWDVLDDFIIINQNL